jgi:UDP:flavonoid glycosyltransferase YjiC (YdhE family)
VGSQWRAEEQIVDSGERRQAHMVANVVERRHHPPLDWPESIVMVGPCEWDPPAEPPRWLEEITAPIVLVTTSSEFQDGRLVQAALDGLEGEPFTIVATLPAGDPANFRAPSNARVERFIRHAAVLDRAVCAVTHAGMGATQKALARGVPVCAVPFGRDQFEVARRVEVAGAGTRLRASRLSPERLRLKVREALTKAEGAKRVRKVSRRPAGRAPRPTPSRRA